MPEHRVIVEDGKGNRVEDRIIAVTTTSQQDNERSIRSQTDQAIAALEGATRTKVAWDALTAAQRQEVTRLGLAAIAKIARLVLGRLDAA